MFSIHRIDKGYNEGCDYFAEVIGKEYSNEAPPKMHDSFYEAFDEMHYRFPWHTFQAEYLDLDFQEYVADSLVSKLDSHKRPYHGTIRRILEEVFHINLRTREVEVSAGIFFIEVAALNKDTNYHYQEFVHSYAADIGKKFKLESITESWETSESESFDFVGNLKLSGNAVVLLDCDEIIRHILPADKYKFSADPITYTEWKWEWTMKT